MDSFFKWRVSVHCLLLNVMGEKNTLGLQPRSTRVQWLQLPHLQLWAKGAWVEELSPLKTSRE